MAGEPSDGSSGDRDLRLREVLAEVILRRGDGETLPDEDVSGAYPDLMPDLLERLSDLRSVERAERLARGFDQSVNGTRARHEAPRNWIIDSIPGFQIEKEIHRGGQGVLYRARQLATGRDVAIKVMHDGPFFGPRDKARFDREVRILGQIRHPNIVTIHDRGVASGCHYFVMDYIEGRPLDDYVARHPLTIEQKLGLFLKICRAVDAAHLRGIIHRDLKPGNIRIDEHGEPHVLDFGLAKVATEEIEDESQWRQLTMTGQFLGTLPWASPEQAERPAQADLRTDVYSLGAVLYQMLTGRLPYPVSGNVRDLLTQILDMDPTRPRSIDRNIDPDLETILLKCLAKEPDLRYHSVGALVDDIDRYLHQQPILARSPSAAYQLKKLIGRHKLPFALLAALFVTVMTFAIAMAFLYGSAVVARDRAVRAESLAEERRGQAEREARTAEAIKEFLVQDLLAAAKPEIALGRKVTVEEVVANAARRIDAAFATQPQVEAAVRTTLGQVYYSLGLYHDAEAHLQMAVETFRSLLGDGHPETLKAELEYVRSLEGLGQIDKAMDRAEQHLQSAREALGGDSDQALAAASTLAQLYWRQARMGEAAALADDVLTRSRQRFGEDHPRTFGALTLWISLTDRNSNRSPQLEALLLRALDESRSRLGDDHPDTLRTMANLGSLLFNRRRFAEAEPLLKQGYEGLCKVYGYDHPSVYDTGLNYANLLKEKGRVREAARLMEHILNLSRTKLGDEHPLTYNALRVRSACLCRQGCPAEAVPVLRDLGEISGRMYVDSHPEAAFPLTALSNALMDLGYFEEAAVGQRRAIEVFENAAHTGTDYRWALRHHVSTLAALGKAEEARPFSRRLIELRRQDAELPDADAWQFNSLARDWLDAQPPDLRDPALALEAALRGSELSSDDYHYNRYTVARAYEANSRRDLAVEFAERALAASPIECSSERAEYESLLVRLHEALGRRDRAEQVHRDTLTARLEHFGDVHEDVAETLFNLGAMMARYDRSEEAEALLGKCLEIRLAFLESQETVDCPQTLTCQTAEAFTALAVLLSDQGRNVEAVDHFARAKLLLNRPVLCNAELSGRISRLAKDLQARLNQADSPANE